MVFEVILCAALFLIFAGWCVMDEILRRREMEALKAWSRWRNHRDQAYYDPINTESEFSKYLRNVLYPIENRDTK